MRAGSRTSLVGSLPIEVSPGLSQKSPLTREPAVVGLQIGLSLLPPALDLVAIAVVTSRGR